MITSQRALILESKIMRMNALHAKQLTQLHINPNMNIRMVYARQPAVVTLTAMCWFG
jgi:hypothetical protein